MHIMQILKKMITTSKRANTENNSLIFLRSDPIAAYNW